LLTDELPITKNRNSGDPCVKNAKKKTEGQPWVGSALPRKLGRVGSAQSSLVGLVPQGGNFSDLSMKSKKKKKRRNTKQLRPKSLTEAGGSWWFGGLY